MLRLLVYFLVGITTCLFGIFGTFYFLMPAIPELTEAELPQIEASISTPPAEKRLLRFSAPNADHLLFDRIAEANSPTLDNHYKHTQTWVSDDGINIYCEVDRHKAISEAERQFRRIFNRNFRLVEKDQASKDKDVQIYFEAVIGEFSGSEGNPDRKVFRIARVDKEVQMCSSSSLTHLLSFENNYVH